MLRFRTILTAITIVGTASAWGMPNESLQTTSYRRLPIEVYRDKMKGAWLGQMVGVSWGAPTECRYCEITVPDDKVPAWHDELPNEAFVQDDLYVEMTFIRTLETRGINVSQRLAGLDFAHSQYGLDHANRKGRANLRMGIAPPDSGHPKFNRHADDIDWQIDSDFTGILSPGMPNNSIGLSEKFGTLMNYGDGLYGGQFVGAMYAAAYFEKDPVRIVEEGLKAIPKQSQYAECVRDVLAWHKQFPDDWRATWKKIYDKYNLNKAYRKGACEIGVFNIDAKFNGAFIVVGLLYGKGDPDLTTKISMQCGHDSDCNPSSALGILGASIGYDALPAKYKRALDTKTKFSFTDYNFADLTKVCEKLTKEMVVKQGGKLEGDTLLIPVQKPKPSKYAPVWAPAPPTGAKYKDDEIRDFLERSTLKDDIKAFAPGWKVEHNAVDGGTGVRNGINGRDGVLVTHPFDLDIPCLLTRSLAIPTGKKTTLELTVGHYPGCDWSLIVRVDGKQLLEKTIGPDVATKGWLDLSVDLSAYAGKSVQLELQNKANGWASEFGYWSKIRVVSE